MKKVLVSGGHGFVGQKLVPFLREKGFDVFAPTTSILDITDLDSCKKVVEEFAPDHIYHLAGVSYVPEAEKDFSKAIDINVAGTDNLCRACIGLKQKPIFLFVSSADVYGPVEEMPITEKTPLNTTSNYGFTKRFAEILVSKWHKNGVINARIARPFNHLGTGQDSRFVVSSFATQISELKQQCGGTIKVGNLEAAKDFSDVHDIINGYYLFVSADDKTLFSAVSLEYSCPLLVFCSGKPVTIAKILDDMIASSGVPVKIEIDKERWRPNEVISYYGNAQLSKECLQWSTTITLDKTLSSIFQR